MNKQLGSAEAAGDRRNARRFEVAWPVVLKGCDTQGTSFEETTELANISSGGAVIYSAHRLSIGTMVDLSIQIPFGDANWISYSAEVIRAHPRSSLRALAVRFLRPRPLFL